MLGGRVVKMMVSDKKDLSRALNASDASYKDSIKKDDDDIGKKILADHQRRMWLYGGIM
jgi:hypothetical protein